MLESVSLRNFKIFADKKIDLSPLTVLAGKNAEGKSTVLQAIRAAYFYPFTGDGSTYWAPDRIKSTFVKSDVINVGLSVNGAAFELELRVDEAGNWVTSRTGVVEPAQKMKLTYLSADRLGPRDFLPMTSGSVDDSGIYGESVFSYIESLRGKQVEEHLRLKADHQTFAENIDDWLGVIAPDMRLTYENSNRLWFPKYNGIPPTNTGYGLSYTLPVIVDLLCVDKRENGDVLLLENPEAHLHPAAQTKIGELIAISAALGKQVIVETHSDHVLDGIRLAVKGGKIGGGEVGLLFFRDGGIDRQPEIDAPEVASDGKLSFWPDGFFDEALKNKSALSRG